MRDTRELIDELRKTLLANPEEAYRCELLAVLELLNRQEARLERLEADLRMLLL